ncbi:hypothetical protein ACJA88_013644 [Fusarium oxysporum]
MKPTKTQRLTGIEDLPLELLSHVFSQLCIHCTSSFLPEAAKIPHYKIDIIALIALSHTSKRFRGEALPIIFHDATLCFTGKYVINMFDYGPYLAQSVKKLVLPFPGTSSTGILPSLKRIARGLSLDMDAFPQLWDDQESVATGLLLALCPNVEWMQFNVSDSRNTDKEAGIKIFQNIYQNNQLSSAFNKLRRLGLDSSDCRTFSMSGPELPMFLREFPHLKVLDITGSDCSRILDGDDILNLSQCRPALESLTDLYIGRWLLYGGNNDSHTLKEILEVTRNLKNFTFNTDDVGSWGDRTVNSFHVSPAQLVDFLTPVQETLRRLVLHFGRRTADYHYQPGEPVIISPDQMEGFKSLEILELDATCFCRGHSSGSTGHNETDEKATYLTKLLPPTVQDLTLWWGPQTDSECLTGVFCLGLSGAAAGHFPKLATSIFLLLYVTSYFGVKKTHIILQTIIK